MGWPRTLTHARPNGVGFPNRSVSDGVSHEQIIGERYALYGPIASGGMATVHFGRLLAAGGFARTVAIKRVHGEFLETPEIISTLLDEARLASRIRHPNVVATLDMVAESDEMFLVMEYVSGESLSRLLTRAEARGEPVEPRIAAGILTGVLYGLHAAHEATDEHGEPLGIVHRDVSPQNVLVGTDGLARLLDFGIAKGKGRLQVTRAGQLKGKVGYMAPEQILGEEPDRRSDVYAAAVVLWEVLTGKRLFALGTTAGENFNLIPKILEADIEPPGAVAPQIPAKLNGIVMRGLNREPDARYRTARDFAIALEDATAIATHRQIGEWVQELAADALAERAVQLQALESASTTAGQSPGRRGSRDLVDTAVRARRRKRLASLEDAKIEAPPTTPDHEPMHIADDATEVESSRGDELIKDMRGKRDIEPTDPKLARTQLAGGMAAAEAKRRAAEIKRDAEGLTKTTKWKKDEPAEVSEAVTKVYEPAKMLSEPPELPGEQTEPHDMEQLHTTLQSHYRAELPASDVPPVSSPTMKSAQSISSGAPSKAPSSAPGKPPSSHEELKLPVASNAWVFIVLAVVVLGALIGLAYKLWA